MKKSLLDDPSSFLSAKTITGLYEDDKEWLDGMLENLDDSGGTSSSDRTTIDWEKEFPTVREDPWTQVDDWYSWEDGAEWADWDEWEDTTGMLGSEEKMKR